MANPTQTKKPAKGDDPRAADPAKMSPVSFASFMVPQGARHTR